MIHLVSERWWEAQTGARCTVEGSAWQTIAGGDDSPLPSLHPRVRGILPNFSRLQNGPVIFLDFMSLVWMCVSSPDTSSYPYVGELGFGGVQRYMWSYDCEE